MFFVQHKVKNKQCRKHRKPDTRG